MSEAADANSAARRHEFILIASTWLVLAVSMFLLARKNLHEPGLYYDEAVFGGMAKDFIMGQAHPHIPEAEIVTLAGRPFPLLVQPYLGGLKSWMLMPALSVFGSTVPVLRLTTLVWAMIALLLIMLAAWRWLGAVASITTGVLLTFDPNWFFLSVLDWGAAVPSFVCRGACFYFVIRWIHRPKTLDAFLAGFFAGLGFFNKADFVLLLAGSALAAIACYWSEIRSSFQNLARATVPFFVGFVVGCAPLLVKLPWIFAKVSSGTPARFELEEKLNALTAMWDGTYFCRLMNAGGVFERMYQASTSPRSGLAIALLIALAVTVIAMARRQADQKLVRAAIFTLTAGIVVTLMVIALPQALRIHHFALATPFPQLFVGIATATVFNASVRTATSKSLTSFAVVVAIALLLGSQLRVIHATQQLISRTGGRGWWSDSLDSFCRENRTRSDLTIVSLDWGFNEQLVFLTAGPRLEEPVWTLEDNPQMLSTDPRFIYLAHPAEYSEYGYDTQYLEAARNSVVPVKIEEHHDREGQIAFYTIQFESP